MLQLYKNIKSRRVELNMTQSDLAKLLGYADKSMIAKIEKGAVDLPQSKILAFADALQISPGDLMGLDSVYDNDLSHKKGVVINVLGRVAAGIPIETVEDIIDTEEITKDMARTGDFFGLQIHGNSMEPRMKEGDVVIVRQQDDAESGDIVIATVNGNEGFCKRLRKYRDGIELISNNPSYEPMFFSNKEIEEKTVEIIGRVVELRAKF